MAKRLDSDIRAVAELAQARRDGARTRVAEGEIPHLRFMDEASIGAALLKNLEQAVNHADAPWHQAQSLADVIVYGLTRFPAEALGVPAAGE